MDYKGFVSCVARFRGLLSPPWFDRMEDIFSFTWLLTLFAWAVAKRIVSALTVGIARSRWMSLFRMNQGIICFVLPYFVTKWTTQCSWGVATSRSRSIGALCTCIELHIRIVKIHNETIFIQKSTSSKSCFQLPSFQSKKIGRKYFWNNDK